MRQLAPDASALAPSDIIERGKLGAYQIRILLLCALAVVFDGFDVQAMGFVAPAIKQEWQVGPAVLGPIFSASLFGMVIGSLLLSALADRIGRRPVLIGAVLASGVMTLASSTADTVQELMVLRFITGIGLGAILPNALALISEYSPARYKTTLVMLIACCLSIGAAVGGATAALLIPDWGWRAVFVIGGVGPLVIGVLMLFLLPESLAVLLARDAGRQPVIRILQRIAPDLRIADDTPLALAGPVHQGVPVRHLFSEGRTATTLLLWLMHFANLAILYFLANWLPTLVRAEGMPLQTAVIAGSIMQGASVLGALCLARLITHYGFFRVLPASYLIGAFAIALIGHVATSAQALFCVVFVVGFCAIGGLNGINALAVASYPASLRTTGIGWALGLGRFGSILAPLVGGILVANQWSVASLFLVAAAPALLLAGALLLMQRLGRGEGGRP
ncbi:MAG: MFS transporter [Burkholderiaceae bacterium]|nr:MFS transporter [Burkholderiaceae bacterium]